jgi:cellulose synthase/poly-beta-1,6-N-acetylglucosamine synthase-like glycosyltransferase
MSMDISVVAATHNRAERLAAMIEGLRAQTLPIDRFEVVIVDDASSDETPEVLRREAARNGLHMRFVRQEQGGGPARARNRGWRMANGTFIAFTDDDCVPTPGWLEALLAAAGEREDVVVQGQTLPNPDEAEGLGPFARTMNITGATPHFETCNIMYPRALLERLEGFDEQFPAPAGEDSDLGVRAQAAGGAQLYEPAALVHHAVFTRTPVAALRDALQATDGVQSYKQNPELREHLVHGVFYDRSHPLLLQAAYGAWLARRSPSALVLAVPYLMNVRARSRAAGGSLTAAPWYVAFDALHIAATVRGAIRHRFPVL